jgi:hypothetical protein
VPDTGCTLTLSGALTETYPCWAYSLEEGDVADGGGVDFGIDMLQSSWVCGGDGTTEYGFYFQVQCVKGSALTPGDQPEPKTYCDVRISCGDRDWYAVHDPNREPDGGRDAGFVVHIDGVGPGVYPPRLNMIGTANGTLQGSGYNTDTRQVYDAGALSFSAVFPFSH